MPLREEMIASVGDNCPVCNAGPLRRGPDHRRICMPKMFRQDLPWDFITNAYVCIKCFPVVCRRYGRIAGRWRQDENGKWVWLTLDELGTFDRRREEEDDRNSGADIEKLIAKPRIRKLKF